MIAFGDLAHRFVADGDAQLPGEMIGKARGRGEELVERRLLDFLVLAARRALAAAVEVLFKEGAEIEFIEGIGRSEFPELFRFPLSGRLRRCSLSAVTPSSPSSSSTGFSIIS